MKNIWFVVSVLLTALQPHAIRAQDASLDTCWSCHGQQGLPTDATIPIIRGQRADYIEAQLRAYRSGDRENQIMNSMAESLTREDIPRQAALIASLGWPHTTAPQASAGADLVAGCKGCHGADLMGGPSPVGPAPRLAGQNAAYLKSQMVAFAEGQRSNQEVMQALMKTIDADSKTAIAAYLAGLATTPTP